MYRLFEQFTKPVRYEERVEHERELRWLNFKWIMKKVYELRTEYDKTGDDEVTQICNMTNEVTLICSMYKSCCIHACCIGYEKKYSNSKPIENSTNFENIYKILKEHGIEEGLIRTFEQMPQCIDMYRDVIKYYKRKQGMEPPPKEHDKIDSIYNIIWLNKTTQHPVEWVHTGIIHVYKEMPNHLHLISVAIIRLRRKLGKKSLLLSRLHTKCVLEFYCSYPRY